LEAIRSARQSVQLEFYEVVPGEISRSIVDALIERARQGVAVHLVVDALGSFGTPNSFFDGLRQAGGQMHWYHPVRFKDLPFINRRTHRKMMVVDSRVGFMGGAGIADHWIKSGKGKAPWRDTMFRVRGSAVLGMVSTLAQNWLECSGEILTLPIAIQQERGEDAAMSLVVPSTPEEGATQARVLYQVLLDSARESILITTPYFLPDRSARHALVRAMRERGVRVQIITNGRHIDHPSIRQLSRSMELNLLRAGAEVYEYQPGMIHAKVMIVDGCWSVLGSTNFDHRSFALNNEVNMAVVDRCLATDLQAQMAEDISRSKRVTVERLRRRSLSTRIADNVAWLLRREA
jgi:cardiolipin synthase